MKRLMPALVIVVALLVGVAIYAGSQADKPATKKADNAAPVTSSESKYSYKKACDILTPAIARQLLGNSVTGGPTVANSATNDIEVSHCQYSQPLPANAPPSAVADVRIAIILVRAAKTDEGAKNNYDRFYNYKPQGSQDVKGYGESAYWNPTAAQLNIFKNNNWYFLTHGKTAPEKRSLEETKKMADLIISQL